MPVRYRHIALAMLVAATLALVACAPQAAPAPLTSSDTGIWVMTRQFSLVTHGKTIDDKDDGSFDLYSEESRFEIDDQGNILSETIKRVTPKDSSAASTLSKAVYTRDANGFALAKTSYTGINVGSADEELVPRIEETYDLTYDEQGRVVHREVTTRDKTPERPSSTDGNTDDIVTTGYSDYTYNAAGGIESDLAKTVTTSSKDGSEPRAFIDKVIFDERGAPIAFFSGFKKLADRSDTEVKPSDLVNVKWQYGPSGRPTESIYSYDDFTETSTYEYDENGNVIRRKTTAHDKRDDGEGSVMKTESNYEWAYVEHPSLAARIRASELLSFNMVDL